MTKFKCIKPTIGFEIGKVYETEKDGTILAMMRYPEHNYAAGHIYTERELSMYTEFFEEVKEEEKWFLLGTGEILQEHEVTIAACPATYNMFDSKEAAEMEALRRESMAKRWQPGSEQDYWYFCFEYMKAIEDGFYGLHADYNNFFIGNCHKTKEEAEAWGDKYAKAFEYLLNN